MCIGRNEVKYNKNITHCTQQYDVTGFYKLYCHRIGCFEYWGNN